MNRTVMKIGRNLISSAATIAFLTGCEYQASFSLIPSIGGTSAGTDGGSGGGGVGGGGGTGQPAAPACFNEHHVQPAAQITHKIDILFVSDTSGSLSEERVAISSGIDSFIASLPANVDFRLALLPAHGPNSSYYGKMLRRGSEPRVLDSNQQSIASIRSDFIYKNGANISDNSTDGGEVPLLALMAATTGTKLTDNRAAGFFRPDAALAVILVSDENDICATYPAGVTPVPDAEHIEPVAKNSFCRNAQGQDVVNQSIAYQHMRTFMGDRPLLFASITYLPDHTYPHIGENEPGYGLFDMADLGTAHDGVGAKVDLAAGNFAAGLTQVGQLSTRIMTLISAFALGQPAAQVNVSSIQVRVDGELTASSYDASRNTVVVADPGDPLSTVDIDYCLNAE